MANVITLIGGIAFVLIGISLLKNRIKFDNRMTNLKTKVAKKTIGKDWKPSETYRGLSMNLRDIGAVLGILFGLLMILVFFGIF